MNRSDLLPLSTYSLSQPPWLPPKIHGHGPYPVPSLKHILPYVGRGDNQLMKVDRLAMVQADTRQPPCFPVPFDLRILSFLRKLPHPESHLSGDLHTRRNAESAFRKHVNDPRLYIVPIPP